MNQVVLQSLQQISTGYSVFEKDQVLTHSQLNTVAEYFGDQTRLTRTKLLGVGIICGLRVSTDGDNVTVTEGAGITTDGDLLYLSADTEFELYKLYDESNPTYSPFSSAINAKKIYEWRPKVNAEARLARPTGQFNANQVILANQLGGGRPPRNNMVAVLFMEQFIKDEDICTGTDCDNLGQNLVSHIKLLLVDKSVVGPLKETIPTPDQAAQVLTDITADRPLFPPTANSPAKIAAIYKTACQSIHQKLVAQLQKLYPTCRAFLGDTFPSDPTSGWMTTLNKLTTAFPTSLSGIQYYYDFLNDLVETYNDFHQLLFGDKTWCCPDTDSFPKHLLLGDVVASADSEVNRTGFYPSSLTSDTTDRLKHARFLARKLSTLIGTFNLPATTGPIRITPSRFGDVRLEERAIPYYYEVNSANPIQNQWSYRLHQQGMDAWNYSYHAAAYGAQGGAAHPLTSQIGGLSFFRIEGARGLDVADAKAAIEAEIKKNNLPFVVQPVLLGTDRNRVIKEFGVQHTDLYSLHNIVRTDLFTQLEDVKTFSAHYLDEVKKPVTNSYVSNISQLRDIATDADNVIKDETVAAKGALGGNYAAYKANPTAWKSSVKTTMNNVALYKKNLADVTQTAFTTPFDSFIASNSAHWLNWLDIIIEDNEVKNVEKLLYANFRAQHPGLEHFAGVVAGGTFVLAYDTNNVVVADFMLPYHCCKEVPQIQPSEPHLPRPTIKTETALGGIKITPEIQTFVGTRLDRFTHLVIDPKLLNARETEFSPASKSKGAESASDATVTETKKPPKTKQPKVKSRKTKRKADEPR